MEKIAINANRLNWCLNTGQIDIEHLSSEVRIAKPTLMLAMENHAVLSVSQLEKIAHYFKRSVLFFLDPNEVQEEKIYTPQFRTINNQKPIHSSKLRTFIEHVEKLRQIYIGLLEDLGEPINENWYPDLDWNITDIKKTSVNIREWLDIPKSYDFNSLRHAVENKGIIVIVSNRYNGKWQIDKNDPVRGFSLYYEILPIIVIKKQASEGAQAFTLMHELGHLLLHKESIIDNEEDFYNYQGKEKEANEFAGNLLIPDVFLGQVDIEKLLSLEINEYDGFLNDFKKQWCVSGQAILVRLLRDNKIPQHYYQDYIAFQEKKYTTDETKIKLDIKPIPRKYRYREPINVFGKPYVYAVLDSLHNKHITLAKASTYLDDLKISDLRQLERHV
ncbi:MAG: peptidase [Methylomonas sp.]|nr:MAG: peptidase [Methylobacter sp.]PPD36242.1 MAG: peptidase [Methylomonas sp.]